MTDVNHMKVPQLHKELKRYGLSTKGKKAELCKRLLDHIAGIEKPVENSVKSDFLKIYDFNNYVNEYEEFKMFVTDRLTVIEELSTDKQNALNVINDLQKQNEILLNELKNKDVIIELLRKESTENYLMCKKSRKSNETNKNVSKNNTIELKNRFEALHVEPTFEIIDETVDDEGRIFQRNKTNEVRNDSFRRNGFPIDHHPERNTLTYIHPNQQKSTVPGQTSYANMVSSGKKIAVYGDSLVKRIKTHEFNKYVKGKAFIKSFPGAKCIELNHYIDLSLKSERPDCVVIHVGTNEIKHQKDNGTIANEILDIARKCRMNGVNHIFVSGIVSRSGFEATRKLKDINDRVRDLCIKEKFHYICNNSITKEYLWTDGIHLLDEGTNLLANNFINAVNAI